MSDEGPRHLSRREREILDIVYALGRATAAQVRERMVDPPSYSAVRGLIRILEEKEQLKHRREGVRNVYEPRRAKRTAGRSAMKRALETFFGGDVHAAATALLDVSRGHLSEEERERWKKWILEAREEGR